MPIITNEDKKLFEKIDETMKKRPSEQETIDFWLDLSVNEYNRLIYLFENNEIEKMSKEIRLKLVAGLKKLREGLATDKNRKLDET